MSDSLTDEQRNALRKFASRLSHDAINVLWPGNVIHGERLLQYTKGRSVSMSDIGDCLLGLQKVQIVQPLRFNPSVSGAAFLGLSANQRGKTRIAPDCEDAAHWDWQIISGTEWGYEWNKLVDAGQERRYSYAIDHAKWPVWLNREAGEEFRKCIVQPTPLSKEEIAQRRQEARIDHINQMSEQELLNKLFGG